ncbi:MAG: hypothetical protein GY910_06195 [bacterium]|nr:hypothetical protein [bacterium]
MELGGGDQPPALSRANYYKRHRSGRDKRIDFLFVRPGAEITWRAVDTRLLFTEPTQIREIDRSLSDHFGFRAELRLASGRTDYVASHSIALDLHTFVLARHLLDVGWQEADRRERTHFQFSALWPLLARWRAAAPDDRSPPFPAHHAGSIGLGCAGSGRRVGGARTTRFRPEAGRLR